MTVLKTSKVLMRVLCVFVMLWQALLCMENIYFIRWTTARHLISLVPTRFEAKSSIEDTVPNAKWQWDKY